MATKDEQQRVMETLPEVEGITPEAIANAKAMIGLRLRTENFIRDASVGSMLNFVNGIGDSNPIFRDQRSEERRVGKECRSRWSPYH